MSRLLLFGAIGLAAVAGLGAIAVTHGGTTSPAVEAGKSLELRRFASAADFERYLGTQRRRQAQFFSNDSAATDAAMEAPAAAAPAGEPANPEITNNQTVGVDEGGIVKQIGRHLVVLQDGRLFSADLGTSAGAPLRLADRIDVYRSPQNAASWYDEMLVQGDRILVTAYNYREQASEITVVRMDEAGRLSREGRYLLSSSDYYSTENYATRLVGDNLVFYAPHALESGPNGGFRWPRLRRADGDGEAGGGDALIGPTDVYQPVGEIEWPMLHTVSICPLRRGMDCRTTAFIGPPMREFYVSPSDAFLWIGAPDGLPWSIDYANQRRQACPAGEQWHPGQAEQAAMLYRLPLDGGAVGAVAVEGIPADQFAFDSREGRFRALLARTAAGCVKPDEARTLALLDLPLSDFGASVRHAADAAYTPLPPIEAAELENRFLGDWLVYGGRAGWSALPEPGAGRPAAATLIAVPLARPREPTRLALPHNALRIERAGGDAVVTGYRDMAGLSISYVSLGARPRIASTFVLPGRFESEGRSHAFNAWVRRDGSGLIGLPTTLREYRAGRGWSDSESSDLSFIAIGPGKALTGAGELGLGPRETGGGYRCEVSCVDWYGNSRPIFTGGRIFALMGTDLVEGGLSGGRIGELGRLDLTGPTGALARRGP
ncbi:MAG TPA: beta-propeller domain-containing protein [Allosphingosinicella sp.]|nr:beta-propeller domain-containing protein [Allosphingosinicella sp.]